MYLIVQCILWFSLILVRINAYDTCGTPDRDLATHSFPSPFDPFHNPLSMDGLEEFGSINETFSMYKTELHDSVIVCDSDLLKRRKMLIEEKKSTEIGYRRTTTCKYDSTKYIPNPDKCQYKEYGFCTNLITEYPNSEAEILIEKNTLFKVIDSVEDEEIIDSGLTHICNVETDIVYPQAAQLVHESETENKWYYLVNPIKENKGLQKVSVLLCNKNNRISQAIQVRSDYEAKCEQMYHVRSMVAINQTGHIFKGDFKFPCCCVCYIVKK